MHCDMLKIQDGGAIVEKVKFLLKNRIHKALLFAEYSKYSLRFCTMEKLSSEKGVDCRRVGLIP